MKVVAEEYKARIAAADRVAGKEKEREKALGGAVRETAEGTATAVDTAGNLEAERVKDRSRETWPSAPPPRCC